MGSVACGVQGLGALERPISIQGFGAADPDSNQDRRLLRVLLDPGEVATRVRAPFPVRLLGTGHYRGASLAHVELQASQIPPGAPTAWDLLVTTRTSDEGPARSERFDPAEVQALLEDLTGLVHNRQLPTMLAKPALTGHPTPRDFRPSATPSLEGSRVEMLILTREVLRAAFESYAKEKTAWGTPTVVVTVEEALQLVPRGADLQETLRFFVRLAYQTWGIRSLLIGGDTDLVPVRYAASEYTLEGHTVPTDLYYVCLDGNWNADGDADWGEGYSNRTQTSDQADLYPELEVGRLPVETPEQVSWYRDKLRRYTHPEVLDYQNRFLFLAEVIWPSAYRPTGPVVKNGADNAERIIAFNDLARPDLVLTKLYETPSGYTGAQPLNRASGLDAMNQGASIVTDIGHGFRYTMSLGDASITNLEARALDNDKRPFFLNMLNCSATAFDYPCLAEKFLLNPTGGAVGVIGASREAYPDNIQLYQEAWFDALSGKSSGGAAEALTEARLAYLGLCYDDGAYRWSNFITAYLGDPKLDLWLGSVRPTSLVHDGVLMLEDREYVVQVRSGSEPVTGALVCLQQPGELYDVQRTDANGTARLQVRPQTPGTAAIRVSGAGLRPVQAEIQIATSQAPVLRTTDRVRIQDQGPDTSGDGNGRLDAGERAWLRFEIRNEGLDTARQVSLRVVQWPQDELHFPNQTVAVGDVPPGGLVVSGPLEVHVGRAFENTQPVRVELVLQSAWGGTWEDGVSLVLQRSWPELVRITIEDELLGNGNGVVDPGETVRLGVEIRNAGSANLQGAIGRLVALDDHGVVLDDKTSFGTVAPRARADGGFRVRQGAVSNPARFLVLVLDAEGRSFGFPVETRRPEPPTDLVGLIPSRAGEVVLQWQGSPAPDRIGYAVYRAPHDQGPWSRRSADLVVGTTTFRDHDLPDGERYRYRVVAVDSSHQESVPTPAVQVATHPPRVSGWPRRLGAWSASSPVLVDFDADGRRDVWAGSADGIYVWRADGSALGTADPMRPGFLGNFGGGFQAALAAGDLDGDGVDEVVAASWNTRSVSVLETHGRVRTGWPRFIDPAAPGIWAAPVLADLDGRPGLEVLVLGLDGRLYAWRADGSELVDGDDDPTTSGVLFAIPGRARWSRSSPAVADLVPDADGLPEIVLATETGALYVLRVDGQVVPGWPQELGVSLTASPSLGDVDADGTLDIVIPATDGLLHVFGPDGSTLPGWPRPLVNGSASLVPSVALHDFTGDGMLEIVAASTGRGAGTGGLQVFDATGSLFPGWPVDLESASEASPILGDLDGDGTIEILYGGESGLLHALRFDATSVPGFPIRVGAEIRSTPTLADLDGDGDIDLLLCGWDEKVHVWDLPGAFEPHRVPWATFGGNARRDGLYRATKTPALNEAPRQTRLYANTPNPFNPRTSIAFEIASGVSQSTRLGIYDVRGRLVRVLLDRRMEPGHHARVWDGRDDRGRDTPSGVYFYRLETPEHTSSRKMVLLR